MNSEVPSIPESDNPNNSNFKPTEPVDLPLEELEVESTSDFDNVWSEEDVIDLTIESDVESQEIKPDVESQENPSELSSLTTTETNLSEVSEVPESTITVTLSEQDTEIVEATESTIPEPLTEPELELFVDSWLDEPKSDASLTPPDQNTFVVPDQEINSLQAQKASLKQEIEALKAQKEQMLLQQLREVQQNMVQIVESGTKELKDRKTSLQIEIENLERRRDRINQEMRSNFAGSSQELAVKVQGFKEYLVGSLQDLARAADKLDLAKTDASSRNRFRERSRDDNSMSISREDREQSRRNRGERTTSRDSRELGNNRDARSSSIRNNRGMRDRNYDPSTSQSQFSESAFADQSKRIRQLIDKYRNNPNYYGSPWQLRRTFEPIHAKKVQDWFFVQGGRGAIDSMGSRLQNILVASAAVSILYNLYGDRCRVLVLTDTPENLGEWRKGLQDCLGISRSNFGSNSGVTLFDAPEVVVQRAERLIEEKLLPLIIIDETEELLNLSVLKFPLWMAFASSAKATSSNYLY
jgi:hypothetical protein